MTSSSTGSGTRYSAFLSYSHEDERWARWLQKVIEAYRVPSHIVGTETSAGTVPRRLAPVFRDRSDLPSASDLGATINDALRASASLIVICSPSARTSRWVNEEIGAFRRLGRGNRIFCLIVAGEPNASNLPGRQDEECLPSGLRYIERTDAHDTEPLPEPVAADVRAGGDGKTNAKLKLISGLLDVEFDVLKRREHHRRYQRMMVFTSLAAVVMVITTVLAIEAQIARRAAEQRQKEAEALVAFMLGDLNNKLRQVQRLDILEAVATQSMAYFLSRPMVDFSDQALLLRVKALQKIGNVREDQGKLPAAIASYLAATSLAAELVRRAPNDPERSSVYAQSLINTGHAYWFQGDLEHALACFQHATGLLENTAAVHPSEDGFVKLTTARTNVGRVLEAHGDYAAAKLLYEKVLETYKTLLAQKPDRIDWQSGLADAYDSLGKIALEQGQLAQAIAAYRDVRRIRVRLLERAPDDRNLQESLLISNAILGRTLAMCGADAAATHYVGEAVTSARALMAFDASQADWRDEFADYNLLLGALARNAARYEDAARHNAESLRVFTDLAATDKTNRLWRRELAGAQVEMARLMLSTGHISEAEEMLAGALSTISVERAAKPADRELRLLETQAHIAIGEASAKRNDLASAQAHWIKARDAMGSAAEAGMEPKFLAIWATTLLLLGNTEAARPAIEQLASMGYQATDFRLLLAAKKQPYPLRLLAQTCGPEEFPHAESAKVE